MKRIFVFLFLLSTLSIKAETESQRFLRLSCEKSNNAKACVLLGKIVLEESPAQADQYFKRACQLGRCVKGFKKQVVAAKKEIKVKLKKQDLGKGFNVSRSLASTGIEKCVDLMRALSQCRSYRCKANHPLVSEHMVVHHILRKDDHCQYTLALPHNKKMNCTLADEQSKEFEGFSQLEAFAYLDDLITEGSCQVRENN